MTGTVKPLIGITTEEYESKRGPKFPLVYGQNHQYSDAIFAAGGIPVLLPYTDVPGLRDLYDRLDGILFSGGNDIDPAMYGEEKGPKTIDVSPERDRVEATLMRWALADDKPLLGICRGHQMFNVVLGGTLVQDIASELPGASDHELSTHNEDPSLIAHGMEISAGSRLVKLLETTAIGANSRHHQSVNKTAAGLNVTAYSTDGVIEALEHPLKTFALSIQCHPESLTASDQRWTAVFRSFVRACQTASSWDQPASALSSSKTFA